MSASRWISKVASTVLGCSAGDVDGALNRSELATAFFAGGEGSPNKLLVYSQNGSVFATSGDLEALTGKCAYFVRLCEGALTPQNVETEVNFGTLEGSTLTMLSRLITQVYEPMLEKNTFGFQKKMKNLEMDDLKASNLRCVKVLCKAVESLESGLELAKLDDNLMVENTPAAIAAAAADPAKAQAYEEVVNEWAVMTEGVLVEQEGKSDGEESGPRTELEFWRARMGKLNSIIEQLKSEHCRTIQAVLVVAKSRVLKRWKACDNAITDAANEAKDNVKYLFTLDKYIEALYSGTPVSILETLPGLLNNIRMMHTIARYYSTTQRMTTLFRKITDQMIVNCRGFVEAGGSLWEQPTKELISNLRCCLETNQQYQEQYRGVRDALSANPKGKQFDFNENLIFGKFDLFCRRVEKLIDMFSTVEQFSVLSKHNLEGMDGLMSNFFAIVADFKRKPYDLLDFHMNQFDRDYLEFNANIHELESSLQGFINASFEHITSTEHALSLLRQFQAILQRDSLKDDLESKFMVIFQNYGIDLETVQRLYEKQKTSPPSVRNAPPVTGNVMWARQLMRRIEAPMSQFKENTSLMGTKESKKLVKVYNKIARTIIEFETLWHLAWTKSIEASKSGLQATLIVRHPSTNKLHVNFDREILQLLRETKCLMRMGIDVPESAKIVLLQEEKFKNYFNLLSYALAEYETVVGGIMPITAPLLKPHMAELERVIQPGMLSLTWTSMNIDAYLHAFHTELMRFNDLVGKIRDIVDNRLMRNLNMVSALTLVELPHEETFTLDKFVEMQERHVKEQTVTMAAKNFEVEEAVGDLIRIVEGYPTRYTTEKVDPEDVKRLAMHFSKLMYHAVLNCTQNGLNVLKKRIGSRSVIGLLIEQMRPFFDVNVELQMPNVIMNPPLSEIQAAVNKTSRTILACSKDLNVWKTDAEDGATSIYQVISKAPEIVRVVLLLTGSVEGAKRQVYEYLNTFAKYDFLWKEDKMAAYEAFMAKNPTLEDFENELRRYVAVESEIDRIPEKHTIGALALDTAPLKMAFKKEAALWKAQYAENLHSQAKQELDAIVQWMQEMQRFMKREVGDLDDVRTAMKYLSEIRDMDSRKDWEFGPVVEKYDLLKRYEVQMPKEEHDMVADLDYSWKKLKKLADDVTEKLRNMQTGFRKGLMRNVRMFAVDVVQFRNDFEANGPGVPGLMPMDACERLRRFQRLFEERARKFEGYQAGELLFGLPVTEYPELEKTKNELQLLDKLYGLYTTVLNTVSDFNDKQWNEVKEEETMEMMIKKLEEFQGACKKMPKDLRSWDAFIELKKMVEDFLESLPLVQQLAHPAMRQRHWDQLGELTGNPLNVTADNFKLSNLLDAGLLEHHEDVEDIASSAVKEEGIEKKMKELEVDWAVRVLSFAQFKSRGPIMLNGGATGELMEGLEEAQMNLGSMMASRFVLPFKEEVAEWILKLSTVSEILETWLQVQSMWQYLEAVFTSGDIARQLPQESKRFVNIDKNWVKIMTKANEVPNVINYIYGNDSLKQLLPYMLEQLELCQKALSGYLDQKRAAFPRFFFVADATLLEVLSQGSNPQAIQAHLASVFDSIESVVFDKKEKTLIHTIESGEGQCVKLTTPVRAEGNIEEWLLRLLNEMMSSINRIICNCAMDCDGMGTEEFTHKYQAQISLIGIQLKWTLDSEDALYRAKSEKGIMVATNKKHNQRLNDLVAMNMRGDQELRVNGKWTRKKIETMILVDVHQRDVFEDVVKKRIKDPEDFEWQKQARFYWRHDMDHAQISVADVDFKYTCEYLGVKDRLVITPLTDRCYITLSQALGMFLGGAPAGPAGTGKTETTKDMGCTLGKYVVVTNCSDQMDFRALGGIYKGLAMSGCWGCFDEFNRIDLEVLSVAAQQVQSVLNAVRDDKQTFQFTDGQVISLNKDVGYFITMNPGYAGRQELPENLKSLFRGVTMMVPDREIIMKVKLTGCGYIYNALLAKKFNVLYRLCEEQLSKQPHYDFGLRNILAVLRTAGASRRAATDTSEKGELLLMMRTLRDMNLSKYVAEDVPLFLALIDDLFPGIRAEKAQHPRVENEVAKVVKATGLQMHPEWLAKIVQIYEMSLVRHSLMAVGPSGVGKSKNIATLQAALSQIQVSPDELVQPMWGQPHKEVRMNPKAITSPQMFGSLDVVANEWTEGIFAQLWRKANKDKKNFTWLVLDGPVDAIWIENMNTVMDDNRILTLANNDRIPMLRPNVTLHFEVEDLRNASPATVSRAGIIYISEADLGWKPYVATFLQSRTKDAEMMRNCFDKFTDPMLEFVHRECRAKMSIADISLMTSLCIMLASLTRSHTEVPSEEALERFFLYSLMWSIAGVLEADDRAKVDKTMRNLTNNLPEVASPDTCFEYMVSPTSHEWIHWGSEIPTWEFKGQDISAEFPSIAVPTIDSVRLEYNIGNSLHMLRPVLLVGNPGTAKTASILQVLDKQDPTSTAFKKVSFSSATSPLLFQRTIEGCVEKRQGKTFGPPGGKKMLVFIDDFSMPEINTWGDQITLEIVRQLIEYVGLYNLDKPGEWKSIVDLTLIGAMLHPGGGKNDIPNRAKRHFHVMNVTLPSVASINQIFGSMIKAKFAPDDPNKNAEVWARAETLVDITITIWNQVMAKMLPTPERFHYIFNLRDLSRVFQGLFMADHHSTLKDEIVLLQLWKHECNRVFSDKLVSYKDKDWFAVAIDKVLEESIGAAKMANIKGKETYFCEFLRDNPEDPETGEMLPAPKIYEPVGDVPQLRAKTTEYMGRFSEAFKLLKMDLVFFADCLEHVLRISRIFAMSRGNALLVGVGGSGKQSLTRLCSYIGSCTFFQSVITRMYSASNLLDDFKPLYRRAGVQGKGAVFIFTDKEIKDEGFLEYINIFLNTGELPNLFPRDELDAIIGEMGAVYATDFKGKEATPDMLWAYFIERVRANLHLSLCFSPVGVKFRTRAQQFPGLINGCTIDWFMPWPEEALSDVATSLIGNFGRLQGEADVRGKVIKHMAFVHAAMTQACVDYFNAYRRNTYVTPKSYLGFISEYKKVYVQKLDHIESLAESINNGLTKLMEAGRDVEKMKVELKEKEKTLVVAQEKSAVLLQDITASTAKAEKKKAEVQAVKDTLAGEAHVIALQKDVVEKDLEVAKPMLEESESALKSITAKDIGLLKSFKQPPDLVKRVFDVVLILFKLEVVPTVAVEVEIKGNKRLQIEASWKLATALMGDIGFLPSVMNFNKDEINDETVELVYPYFALPDMTPDDARKVANALAGLCTWARAMALYVDIAKVVKPKMEALAQAENKLKSANQKLNKAQSELDSVQADLDKMQAQFDEAMANKQRLQEDADATQKKMDAANRLINGLSGERKRWGEQSEAFADEIKRLAGDVALACAFIGYVGPFNAVTRADCQAQFYKNCKEVTHVPVTEDLRVSTFLVDQGTIGDWTLEGLPTDELSVQNGIMVTRSQKWPLMIDPQSQGLGWIKSREGKNQLKITQMSEKRFRNHLEDAMAFGTPLMIENVSEDIDPVLDPVFNKDIQRKGRNLIIQLSDKECEYSESFALFLCSKLANPHYSPEIFAQLTVINFTVTMDGLEQQLLGRVLQKERAELEDQKQKLVEEVNANQKLLKGLEDDLLNRLANSTGNLLDDVELIEVLQMSKTTSVEVQEKLVNAAETEKRISTAREEYRPVATRGSLLYFLVVDMAAINNMYMVSLQQYLELFDYSIDNSDKAPLAAKRIGNIIEYLTFYVTCYMQRGLFERHKKIWVLMLAMKIEQVADRLSAAYVGNLLKGGGSLDPKTERAKPHDWMPENVWMNCLALSKTVQMLHDLPESISNPRSADVWRAFYDHDAPEGQSIPEFHERLDSFERMLIVRALREDRALLSAQDYMIDRLGQRFVESRPLNFAATADEANERVPIIALLTMGSDPTGSIQDLAKKRKRAVMSISLGQGQEPAARKLLSTGTTSGDWVLLQNCHLGLGFMNEVESWLIKLEENPLPTFRLWITAEPHPRFPIGLLQMAIKVTNEAPAGVKAGLRGSYSWISQDMLDSMSQPQWRSMLFALCFMHTVVQERRKFGPLGFNVPYEFNQSDLSASVQFMQNHLNDVENKRRPVDWIVVNYQVCDVQYGGRITDDWDRRLFNTYGRAWLTQVCLDADFQFHEGYMIPANKPDYPGTDIDHFRKYIETLPLVDDPEIFGLHPNADLAFRTLETKLMLSTILDIQPKEGGGGGGLSREEQVVLIVNDLQSKMPPDYRGDDVKQGIKSQGGMGKPLNICLKQEIDRLQKVLKVLRSGLSNLKLGIAGTIVMSPDLVEALDALAMARVPDSWTKVSQLIAPNMGVWFANILKRADQFTTWLKNGRPICFWLTGFFNPSGFLTANRQEVCRRHAKENWALDDVINFSKVIPSERDDVKKAPEEGIYLYGLYLDGAKWDKPRDRLIDSDPKVLFAPLPVLWVSGTLASELKGDKNVYYTCPVYKAPRRTGLNFIISFDLRIEGELPSRWVLRGVALLTSTD